MAEGAVKTMADVQVLTLGEVPLPRRPTLDSIIVKQGHFFEEGDPINQCLGISGKEFESYCRIFADHFDSNLSVVAVSAELPSSMTSSQFDSSIVGGLLVLDLADDPPFEQFLHEHPLFQQVIALLEGANGKANQILTREFALPPTDLSDAPAALPPKTVAHLHSVGMDVAWRGRGVASSLLRVAIVKARAQGYRALLAECSSAFSAAMMKKYGGEVLALEEYKRWVSPLDGSTPFAKVQEPHESIQIIMIRLDAPPS